jgi:hypothetical protein
MTEEHVAGAGVSVITGSKQIRCTSTFSLLPSEEHVRVTWHIEDAESIIPLILSVWADVLLDSFFTMVN